MSERQRKTAIRVANVPQDEFEALVESDDPPTATELAERGTTKREPRPIVDLKGRDPDEFNRALHFVAGLGNALRMLDELNLDRDLPILNDEERARARKIVAQIDAKADSIIERLSTNEEPAAAPRNFNEDFDRFLKAYPPFQGRRTRDAVRRKFYKAVERGVAPDEIITRAQAYRAEREGQSSSRTKRPDRWLAEQKPVGAAPAPTGNG